MRGYLTTQCTPKEHITKNDISFPPVNHYTDNRPLMLEKLTRDRMRQANFLIRNKPSITSPLYKKPTNILNDPVLNKKKVEDVKCLSGIMRVTQYAQAENFGLDLYKKKPIKQVFHKYSKILGRRFESINRRADSCKNSYSPKYFNFEIGRRIARGKRIPSNFGLLKKRPLHSSAFKKTIRFQHTLDMNATDILKVKQLETTIKSKTIGKA